MTTPELKLSLLLFLLGVEQLAIYFVLWGPLTQVPVLVFALFVAPVLMLLLKLLRYRKIAALLMMAGTFLVCTNLAATTLWGPGIAVDYLGYCGLALGIIGFQRLGVFLVDGGSDPLVRAMLNLP